MRICLVFDCLYPYTVGGAERWYRNLAERLAAAGHDVTYLTLPQWERGEHASVPGVEVIAGAAALGAAPPPRLLLLATPCRPPEEPRFHRGDHDRQRLVRR